jgi:hypothetical protein
VRPWQHSSGLRESPRGEICLCRRICPWRSSCVACTWRHRSGTSPRNPHTRCGDASICCHVGNIPWSRMACRVQRLETRGVSGLVSTYPSSYCNANHYFFRNFAATQTKGISCAIYKKFPTKADAEEAYEEARRDGFVEVLTPL